MVNHWLILIGGYSRGYWGYILIFWDLVCIISRNKCGQHTNYQAYFFELNNEAKSPIHSPLLSILQIWLKLNCIYQNQARILAGEILIFCDLPSGDQAWLAGKPFSCRWLSQRNLHLVRGFSHNFPRVIPKVPCSSGISQDRMDPTDPSVFVAAVAAPPKAECRSVHQQWLHMQWLDRSAFHAFFWDCQDHRFHLQTHPLPQDLRPRKRLPPKKIRDPLLGIPQVVTFQKINNHLQIHHQLGVKIGYPMGFILNTKICGPIGRA